MVVDVEESIVEVPDKAQTSEVTHIELIKSLKVLHDKTELYDFFEAFVNPLRVALVRKEPAVGRVLDFATKFAAYVAPLKQSSAAERVTEEEEGEARTSGE